MHGPPQKGRVRQCLPRPESNTPRPKHRRAFAPNWNALRGWHYLPLPARLLNTLVCDSTGLWALVCTPGFGGTLLFLRETYLNPWLRPERLRALRARPPQLRLMI